MAVFWPASRRATSITFRRRRTFSFHSTPALCRRKPATLISRLTGAQTFPVFTIFPRRWPTVMGIAMRQPWSRSRSPTPPRRPTSSRLRLTTCRPRVRTGWVRCNTGWCARASLTCKARPGTHTRVSQLPINCWSIGLTTRMRRLPMSRLGRAMPPVFVRAATAAVTWGRMISRASPMASMTSSSLFAAAGARRRPRTASVSTPSSKSASSAFPSRTW